MTLKNDTCVSSKLKFWEVHVENWSTSGLTQADYCRQNNLKIKAFGYWKRKLTKSSLALELVQVIPEQIYAGRSLRLYVGADYQVEIPDGFSHTDLKDVLSILKDL